MIIDEILHGNYKTNDVTLNNVSRLESNCSVVTIILSSCGYGTKAVIQTHKSINE